MNLFPNGLLRVLLLTWTVLPAFAAEHAPRIVLVSGEFEYDSKVTLPALQAHLAARHGFDCTYLERTAGEHIPGLEALDQADLAIVMIRRMTLPPDELGRFKKYLEAGRPLIALRTASHAFENWKEFDREVLGGNYHNHHGNDLVATARLHPPARNHPILAGVPDEFVTGGSLYKTSPLAPMAELLLTGSLPQPGADPEPLAWTHRYRGGRIFYSSLGAPADFRHPAFVRMLHNAVYWALDRPAPKDVSAMSTLDFDRVPEAGATASVPDPAPGGANAPAPVNVILWFDTEDYLLPADDDATKRLCELLTARGIRATFKVVGEKARVLERRGRRDVIAALQRHDIGYHTDFHSVHPTPAEYLAGCGWLDGIAEFVRREGDGAVDVQRIFGVPGLSCYGQPGSSWGPQAVAALRQIGVAPHGVPCYVDEDSHVGLDGRPFWYAGALNVFRMEQNVARMELHDPQAVEPAKERVSGIAERLRREGGGLISIFYHPCEWVHLEFWDGVNFARGANPPREQWKPPRQRSDGETDAAFQRFAAYVDHIRAIPGVRWITASELPPLYPDAVRTEGATQADLDELARRIVEATAGGLDYQRVGSCVYSVADQFELLTLALDDALAGRAARFPLKAVGLMGPDASTPPSALTSLDAFALRDAVGDVREFIQREGRVPARVFVGAEAVPPADFLPAMAAAWRFHRQQDEPRTEHAVALGRNGRVLPERHVAPDTPGLYGNWIIHRADFRAPKLVELARLQAWTLKPASMISPQAGLGSP